jgi:anti-anti-sigma factor
LTLDYRPDALEALQAATMSALKAGAPRVILDLNSLDRLDAACVRGLITILRRAREIGGEVALQTNRPDILRSLHVMALDRLFPMVGAAV